MGRSLIAVPRFFRASRSLRDCICAFEHILGTQPGPAPARDLIDIVVGYALTCKMRLPAVADTIYEARYQARQNGRSAVAGVDIQKGLLEYRIPTGWGAPAGVCATAQA